MSASALETLGALRSGDGVTLRMRTGRIEHFGVHATLWYITELGQVHRGVVRRWVSEGWVTEPRGFVRSGAHACRRYRLTQAGRVALGAAEEALA